MSRGISFLAAFRILSPAFFSLRDEFIFYRFIWGFQKWPGVPIALVTSCCALTEIRSVQCTGIFWPNDMRSVVTRHVVKKLCRTIASTHCSTCADEILHKCQRTEQKTKPAKAGCKSKHVFHRRSATQWWSWSIVTANKFKAQFNLSFFLCKHYCTDYVNHSPIVRSL